MKALLIVDIQNDFLPGGALGVADGDKVIPAINRLSALGFDLVVASKDWHPAGHGSFASSHGKKPGEHTKLKGQDQILWPDHCVQGTPGAAFADALETDRIDKVFHKGTEKEIDSYSAFFDNGHLKATGLGDFLREKGVEELYIAGLATDYCVKYSALDALKLRFKVHVVLDACKAVNLQKGDGERAVAEMQSAGAKLTDSASIAL